MYLFFDTETTGLPKNYKAPVSDTENWPRLVQLAFICCEEDGVEISRHNYIVKQDGFEIPKGASSVHGITTQIAMADGHPLEEVLFKFWEKLQESKVLVAHNMSYDEKLLVLNFLEMKYKVIFLKLIKFAQRKAQQIIVPLKAHLVINGLN